MWSVTDPSYLHDHFSPNGSAAQHWQRSSKTNPTRLSSPALYLVQHTRPQLLCCGSVPKGRSKADEDHDVAKHQAHRLQHGFESASQRQIDRKLAAPSFTCTLLTDQKHAMRLAALPGGWNQGAPEKLGLLHVHHRATNLLLQNVVEAGINPQRQASPRAALAKGVG